MSPSTPQNTSRETSSFAGQEFSNNLLSDLAPLLTLFGEQVTKQFLSMSMGWADNLLIALGPLGIMTILVSTIRVGGTQRLKALVGRARESRATAEAELLSSTSDEVCEMWNGQQVVRTFGSPQTSHLVLILESGRVKAISFWEAYDQRILVEASGGQNKPTRRDFEKMVFGKAPNLSLNAPESDISNAERWWWVSMGLTSQLIVLSAPFLLMRTSGYPIRPYGYTCYLVGTIVLSSGLALCSHIIEGSTTEFDFVPNKSQNRELRIITIQRESSVAEQRYSSYMSLSPPGRPRIRMSRFNGRNYKKLCTLSVLASLGGFIIQFLGLRALHWSITVITLSLTVGMTSVRAWVRRVMTSHGHYIKLSNGYEGLDVSTWIEDHTESLGKISIAELKLPDYPVNSVRNLEWLATPARVLTATHCYRRRSESTECTDKSITFGPDLSATAYIASTPPTSHVDLCAELSIRPTNAVEELTLQLISTIKALADHVTQSDILSNSRLDRIGWDMLIVKTSPGLVHPTDSPPPERKQMPQKRSLELHRLKSSRTNKVIWCFVPGLCNKPGDIATFIELDAYAREPLRYLRSSRIIGSTLMNNEIPRVPPRPEGVFSRWLGFVVDDLGFDTLPPASKNSYDLSRSVPIYGCQYSWSWRAAIGDERFARLAVKAGYSCVDLCIPSWHGADDQHLECALEIFYVYMLALASHMRPISSEELYEKRPVFPKYPIDRRVCDTVQRHPEVEGMVDVLTSTAPRLFPDRHRARQMLIPALVYHDLLP